MPGADLHRSVQVRPQAHGGPLAPAAVCGAILVLKGATSRVEPLSCSPGPDPSGLGIGIEPWALPRARPEPGRKRDRRSAAAITAGIPPGWNPSQRPIAIACCDAKKPRRGARSGRSCAHALALTNLSVPAGTPGGRLTTFHWRPIERRSSRPPTIQSVGGTLVSQAGALPSPLVSSGLPPPDRLPCRSWLRVAVRPCLHVRSSYRGPVRHRRISPWLTPRVQRAHAGRTQRLHRYRGARTVIRAVG